MRLTRAQLDRLQELSGGIGADVVVQVVDPPGDEDGSFVYQSYDPPPRVVQARRRDPNTKAVWIFPNGTTHAAP